ncbi:MAG: hypothetical protein WAT81_01835 [Candidatus Moraniibacteriota bacterium]
MPRPEFVRGILPGELPYRPVGLERFQARIVLFEYNPRAGDETLSEQLRRWRRENGLSSFAGYSQLVGFPDAPSTQVLAWTKENFLFREGNQSPYQFISLADYRQWVVYEPSEKPRTCYGNCYSPTGEYLPGTFIVVT